MCTIQQQRFTYKCACVRAGNRTRRRCPSEGGTTTCRTARIGRATWTAAFRMPVYPWSVIPYSWQTNASVQYRTRYLLSWSWSTDLPGLPPATLVQSECPSPYNTHKASSLTEPPKVNKQHQTTQNITDSKDTGCRMPRQCQGKWSRRGKNYPTPNSAGSSVTAKAQPHVSLMVGLNLGLKSDEGGQLSAILMACKCCILKANSKTDTLEMQFY